MKTKVCLIKGCENPAYEKGLCGKHYQQGKMKNPINQEKHNQSTISWRERNPEKSKQVNNKWLKSKAGRQYSNKRQAKRNRKLGWILMFPNPFDNSVPVDYHHVTDAYVVAISKDLHQLYGGKYHREKTMEIVKQIYLEQK